MIKCGYFSEWRALVNIRWTLGHAILMELKLIGVPVLSWQAEDESEIDELVRLPAEYMSYW